jgi:hypothetical protein
MGQESPGAIHCSQLKLRVTAVHRRARTRLNEHEHLVPSMVIITIEDQLCQPKSRWDALQQNWDNPYFHSYGSGTKLKVLLRRLGFRPRSLPYRDRQIRRNRTPGLNSGSAVLPAHLDMIIS